MVSLNPFARFGVIAAVLQPGMCVGGCDPDPPQPPRTSLLPRDYDPTADVPERYRFLYTGGIGYDEIDDVWKTLPFTKIELERTECGGTCPSYVVTFSADGTARYIGRQYTARTGAFDGEVEIWDYGQICWMIDRFKILSGHGKYAANWTDAATTIICVTLRENNDTVEISDYGGQGPVELWSLFNAIDAVSNRIEWKATSK